jgi:endonuclease/exonuclease/phosphatase family metal-dependent hydrolase
MKIMSLNIWGGHVKQPLLDFIAKHHDVDVFCFQEVYHNGARKVSDEERVVYLNIFAEMQALLPEHKPFFRPVVENHYGIAMLVKNEVEVIEEGQFPIYDNPGYPGIGPAHSRILQWANCQVGPHVYTVINIHGLWNGKGKTDSPERILQSQRIREFVEKLKDPFVLCGDFNLRPDTESLQIIQKGMTNLIEKQGITSTRTSFYPKEEKFADYVFTSPALTVRRFEVLQDVVSDHAPLLVEVEF